MRDRWGTLFSIDDMVVGVATAIKELGIEVTPMHPETELRKAGAIFESATAFRDLFATWVSVDDEQRFVTGQNQNSGLETAHTAVNILAQRKTQ